MFNVYITHYNGHMDVHEHVDHEEVDKLKRTASADAIEIEVEEIGVDSLNFENNFENDLPQPLLHQSLI